MSDVKANKCDLDEIKHVAIKRFLELIDEQWEVSDIGFGFFRDFRHKKFKVRVDSVHNSWEVLIGDESIWRRIGAFRFHHEYTKKGKPTKASLAKETIAYAKWENDEVYQAIQKLEGRWRTQKTHERCEKAKAALEESCKKIQQELKGNPLDVIFNPQPLEQRSFWQRLRDCW